MKVAIAILGALMLALSPSAAPVQAADGAVAVMLHVCPEDIRSVEDFDALGGFLQKVLTCPVVTRTGDEGPKGSVSAANQNFSFAIDAPDGSSQTIADARFMQGKLCETDLDTDVDEDGAKSKDTCVDISHYVYSGIPKGELRITESAPPDGFVFGAIEFSPAALGGGNDADTLVSARDGVIELDTARDEDATTMLHVYNFRATSMHGGGHSGGGTAGPSEPEDRGPSKVRRLTVDLAERNRSGVTGTAVFTDNGDGTTRVRLQLEGGGMGTPRPAHLHDGTCEGTVPTVRYPLENTARGTSVSTVPASVDELLAQELFLNVHTKVSKVYTLSPVIACGDLTGPRSLPATGAGGLAGIAMGDVIVGLGLILALAGTTEILRTRRR
jgi:hypothetical protein